MTERLLDETQSLKIGLNILNVKEGKRRLTVVNGGQTGVDRAAFDTAIALMLPCRGLCPDNRWAEDAPLAPHYPVQECGSPTPAVRTELNTIDSDGTLVLSRGTPHDGTPLTVERARAHNKPVLEIGLDDVPKVAEFWQWINTHDIRILNIGGPRESFSPGNVYEPACTILTQLLDPTT